MKTLRRLGLSLILISILGVAALAGETNSPPCPPPDPGETNSPPCAMSQITPDGPEASTETVAPASTSGSAYSVSEAAVDLLQSVLLLF